MFLIGCLQAVHHGQRHSAPPAQVKLMVKKQESVNQLCEELRLWLASKRANTAFLPVFLLHQDLAWTPWLVLRFQELRIVISSNGSNSTGIPFPPAWCMRANVGSNMPEVVLVKISVSFYQLSILASREASTSPKTFGSLLFRNKTCLMTSRLSSQVTR